MFLSKAQSGIYYLWYTDDRGRRQKVSTRSKHKTDALKFVQTFKADQQEKIQPETLSTFMAEFLTYASATFSPGTVDLYRRSLRYFVQLTGDRPLKKVTPREIDEYKVHRLTTVKPASANMELRALKAAMNTAVRWQMIEANPCTNIQQVSVPEVPPTYFTKEGFQTLLSVIREGWLKEMVILAVLTGMRRAELINLRWQNVDLERRLIQIYTDSTFKTKQGKRRVIPLNDTATYLLMSRKGRSPSEYVFTISDHPIRKDHVTRKFKIYVRAAKLKDGRLHFHSTRHTFASWLVQDGASLYEVQKLLGHSSSRVTEVYSHLQSTKMHDVVNSIRIPKPLNRGENEGNNGAGTKTSQVSFIQMTKTEVSCPSAGGRNNQKAVTLRLFTATPPRTDSGETPLTSNSTNNRN